MTEPLQQQFSDRITHHVMILNMNGQSLSKVERRELYFYRNTPMLASGIKGMRIRLRFGSA